MRRTLLLATLSLGLVMNPADVRADGGWDEAVAAFGRADYATARTELESVLESHPDYAPAHSFLGVVLHRLGRSDEAIPSFEAALELAPGDEATRLGLARALLDVGRFVDGLSLVDSVVMEDLTTEQKRQWAQLMVALTHQGRFPLGRLRGMKELAGLLPDDADLWNALGRLREESGDFEGALTAHERALTIEDSEARRNRLLGSALSLAFRAPSDAESEEIYLRVAERAESWTDLTPQTALRVAEVWIGAHRCDRAGPILELARTGPTDLWASYYSGLCAARAGQPEEAIRELETALGLTEAEPDLEPRIRKALGGAYHAAHRYSDAARVFAEAGDTESSARMVEAGEIARLNEQIDRVAAACEERRRIYDADLEEKSRVLGPDDLEHLRRSYAAKVATCEASI